MNYWIPCTGKLEIIGGNVRIRLSNDLVQYYKQFIDKHYMFFTNAPAHGAHITVASEKLHKNVAKSDIAYARNKYIYEPIKIEYNPDIIVGGYTKDFRNYYMRVRSETLAQLSKILKIPEPPRGWHITVSNTKAGVRPYIWY